MEYYKYSVIIDCPHGDTVDVYHTIREAVTAARQAKRYGSRIVHIRHYREQDGQTMYYNRNGWSPVAISW